MKIYINILLIRWISISHISSQCYQSGNLQLSPFYLLSLFRAILSCLPFVWLVCFITIFLFIMLSVFLFSLLFYCVAQTSKAFIMMINEKMFRILLQFSVLIIITDAYFYFLQWKTKSKWICHYLC